MTDNTQEKRPRRTALEAAEARKAEYERKIAWLQARETLKLHIDAAMKARAGCLHADCSLALTAALEVSNRLAAGDEGAEL